MAKFGANGSVATWQGLWNRSGHLYIGMKFKSDLRNYGKHCQRHNGPSVLTPSVSWVIAKVEMKTNCSDHSRYRVNTLDPLCLWQCFLLNLLVYLAWVEIAWFPRPHKSLEKIQGFSPLLQTFTPPFTCPQYLNAFYHPLTINLMK